jgi:hypothetical protein
VFELNQIDNLEIIKINGTNLYIKDNFYKNPHEVLELLNIHQTKLWKSWDNPSYNGTHFLDSRHDFYHEDMLLVNKEIERICKQKTAQPGQVISNCIQFYNKDFNNYKNNYWGPHEDLGYTALIYLNNFDCPGTNIYNRLEEDVWETPEHYDPWRPKDKFELVYTVESKFNRMVLFDGKLLTHGMAIDDDTFFSKTRINQAVFLTN